MAKEPELLAHLEWLGYVQPVGLVVSAPALLNAQAHINRNIAPQHSRFLATLPTNELDETVPEIGDFPEFVRAVFDWEPEDIRTVPVDSLPAEFRPLEIVLPEYNETLRPTWVIPASQPSEGESKWIALIKDVPAETDLDDDDVSDNRRWQASPHSKFERLLRETGVPFGILTNRRSIRLVYAPRGETSGYMTFNLAEMITVAGRPIFAALHMMLCAPRMFSLDKNQRLPAILDDSRKYQNTVSTELAEQVMAALFELLRGFQAANDAAKGKLLAEILQRDPQHVYHGLLTVLMRMVFVLYAEDRGLLSNDSVFVNHYSVSGLYERLRQDAGRFRDTMDQRYGAWAQLLTLYRLIYHGGSHDELTIPARKGYLFDPDRYPFLEGRTGSDGEDVRDAIPRISDGVIYRVLNNLLILQGERLSYRTLDVEQIGSVYEAVMGFELEVATGKSIAIKPAKRHGAPSAIDLEALLKTKPADRVKWLTERTDQKFPKSIQDGVKAATTVEEVLAALAKRIAKHVTPNVVPRDAMVFQPSDERRRSGAHYTPRSLTEPIVRTTLEPILKQLTDDHTRLSEDEDKLKKRIAKLKTVNRQLTTDLDQIQKRLKHAQAAAEKGIPHPSQILDLAICDPAMGSGAFLVEVCRQLGESLIKSWYAHPDAAPAPIGTGVVSQGTIPPDEDEVLYARRLIAQRCLYGVDKNVMAVDLAKLSLWLVTLAKSHPFTFLDHSLRHGDSLVGLTRLQIEHFHWDVKSRRSGDKIEREQTIETSKIYQRITRATEARAKILNAREDVPYRDQEQRMAVAEAALDVVRITGDACVSAFFSGKKKKDRIDRCDELFINVTDWYASGHDINKRGPIAEAAASMRIGEHPIPPFHWEIEFPEVFSRENGGFDAFVGNPPFAGKNTLIAGNSPRYVDWLKSIHEKSHGNSDLVAHFFRRTFNLCRNDGTAGLIATKTIGQGDTRTTGLGWICDHGGTIYSAKRRFIWPGAAAVIVSTVHICRGNMDRDYKLDGKTVPKITAFLFKSGGNDDPPALNANAGRSFIGNAILGMGFTFDDSKPDVANPISLMHELVNKDKRNSERIFPFIGYSEVANSPTHSHHRYIINFKDMEQSEARKWPDLMEIVENKVKPDRLKQKRETRKRYWWRFGEVAPGLYSAIESQEKVLVAGSQASAHFAFAFLPNGMVYSSNLTVIACDSMSAFATIQGRVHEVWARTFMTTMKDDLVYTPTTCFETFPFPNNWQENPECTIHGCSYYEARANRMSQSGEGLTTTYNRFHDPHEQSSEIMHLRELHAAMDRAVLEAYGWKQLAKDARCEFLLDYEEEDDDNGNGKKKSKKKKPWRLRWPDDFRDEVLARLLELNEQRHQEELLAGERATENAKPSRKLKRQSSRRNTEKIEKDLFGEEGIN